MKGRVLKLVSFVIVLWFNVVNSFFENPVKSLSFPFLNKNKAIFTHFFVFFFVLGTLSGQLLKFHSLLTLEAEPRLLLSCLLFGNSVADVFITLKEIVLHPELNAVESYWYHDHNNDEFKLWMTLKL